jgi:signal transduction histidine kinase
VTADVDAGILDEAWGHIPQSREATIGTGTFTRQRVERSITLASGLGSLVVGAQAFVTALGPADERPGWHEPLMALCFVPLGIMILACLVGRGVRPASGLFAVVYVLALLAWPLATAGTDPVATDSPWIWYMVNIATLAAVIAFPMPMQITWAILVPMLYGIARLAQGDFAADFWIAVGLEISFSLILGGILLALGWIFRAMAVNVDEARALAVESYAKAAAADAAEQERVAVAALMHDSVLAALIAAERADGPRAESLAAGMAREALTRLANAEQGAEEGSDEPRTAESIADDIEAAARDLGFELSVTRDVQDAPPLPGRVARALVFAAVQAVANALEHADGAGLVALVTAGTRRVRIEVRDAGGGFDLDSVAEDRLGIRASIIARVAAVGGQATIDSDASGTRVRLDWVRSES